jgi:NAD(P)-dependent dehydrogenase (short-subunit alcohol dehydrogenase family)
MNITMKDRVAVITGGSKGIGIAVARRFAESGAKVAILARGTEGLAAARQSLAKDKLDVRDYVCDVSKAADISRTHDRIVKDLGQVDVLVNNAGTSRAMAFETVTDDIWQEDFDLKLFAATRFSRVVWGGMKERKWGRIINVLNTFAKAPAAASAPTSVSRAAGMALTKVMAGEGGPHNILVNAMLVGLIVSDQWVKRHAAAAPGTDFEAFTQNLAKGVPLGRMGTAEEFANLACFLASEQGSYITGTAINVDGGRSPVV